MATIDGARSLRIDDKVGSLEVGKDADISVFPLDVARVTPVGDVVAAVIFAVAGADAKFVAVRGRPLLVDGVPLYRDNGLRDRVKAAGEALRGWETAQV